MTRDQAKAAIEGLVTRFREHREEFHSADYNETKTRIGLINPFFHALGWDVSHEEDRIESYREVIHEDKVRVKGQMKAPDYGFRVAGQGDKRLFFVEAKKPSVSLKTNREASYQLRIYGRSAQAPVSILTNFEEFIIYDCTKSPKQSDSASSARIKYIHFEDYIKEFDFIYDTLSREAVYSGGFDKFVQSDTYKKGTQTLDKDFVESLDSWRKYLATSIALENKKLNEEEINFVVQQTIDRLIFLRFCEDRGVEQYAQLQKAVSHGNSYDNLYDLFKRADDKYNSGLFDFKKDTISAKLSIKNKVLKEIIEDLYYPSPYVFRVMPVEVLGNAYEQFLGKIIRITSSHSARIEVKPEVRKAGGVYYTPQYIVEYIVKNTVGKLIEGKTPKEIEKIKIVDPACGSGSFLIGAFQYLVKYHSDWYHHHPAEAKKAKALAPSLTGKNGGGLTTSEKKKILLNNIFGVDIDANAVEVTKLSLLLKCMEGETEASIKQQLSVFHERVLPDLDNNIKDGNSLVDTDFYDEFDLGFEKKIKPFSWKKGFPEVFKQGGFDVVIGNPPYSLIGSDRKNEQEYFTKKYELNSYKINTYILFLEKGLKLLKEEKGKFGYIIPKSLVFNTYFDSTRQQLLTNYLISQIVEIREKVFVDAEVGDSILFFGERSNNISKNILHYFKVENIYPSFKEINSFKTQQGILSKEYGGKFFPSGIQLKIETAPLSEICDVFNGLNPGNVKHILLSPEKRNSKYKKMLLGRDIQRYNLTWSGTWVNYDPTLKDRIKPSDTKSKKGMTAQGKVDFALRDENIYLGEKILVRKTADHIIATFDQNEFYYDSLAHGIKLKNSSKISIHFILGLMNSKLINYLHEGLSDNKDKVFAKVLGTNLSMLPIPKDISKNKEKYDEIIKQVKVLLSLYEEIRSKKLQNKVEQIKQHIAHTEEKINKLVYELYNLTDKEIKIIEGEKD